MTFQELFQQVKTRFLGADVSQVSDPTRIQINLTCLLYTSDAADE